MALVIGTVLSVASIILCVVAFACMIHQKINRLGNRISGLEDLALKLSGELFAVSGQVLDMAKLLACKEESR